MDYIMEDTKEFDAVRARLYQVTGCADMASFAEYLGVRQSAISDARRKLRLPVSWLKKIAEQTGKSICWLLEG